MASLTGKQLDMDGKTDQPEDAEGRSQIEKVYGRYSASEAKEGRKGKLPSSHASREQPKGEQTPKSGK
jgi:hypothetical protein